LADHTISRLRSGGIYFFRIDNWDTFIAFMKILSKEISLSAKMVIACGALVLSRPALDAGPLVYAIGSAQFGTMDLTTGAFTKIADTPPILQYLANGPNNTLLTMSFDGNLDSINPANGAVSVIGPTGFGDCSGAVVANLSSCQLSFGQALGKYFATDFNNNLYSINPLTGQATLIGKTGIPALTFLPAIPGADGSFDFYDENLFEANGNLYANFDTGHFQPPTGADPNPEITPTTSAALYEINPITGTASEVADTAFGQGTIANINGTVYSFDGIDGSIDTLDVATGKTTFAGNSDPNLGLVGGVAAVPEPAPLALTCCGLGLLAMGLRKRLLAKKYSLGPFIVTITILAVTAFATPAHAASIPVTYSLAGVGTVESGTDTTLTLVAEANGSILSTDPALNAAWNPITYSDQSVLDLTTGLLTGNFTILFQDGDTLVGSVFEDDSVVDASPTQTGPFPQTLTFTGGTGEFAGATGSVSGTGFLGTTSFAVSGSGTLDTPAVPEPEPLALIIGGLVFITARARRHRANGLLT
jgi:hypothetical protein